MHLPELAADPARLEPHQSGGGWRISRGADPVGRVTLQPGGRACAVGVEVTEGLRDRGIGTGALRAAAAWLLDAGGFARLEARTAFGAWAALRTAEKSGFRYEGLLRATAPDGGDEWLSSRLASDDGKPRADLLPQPWLHGGAVTLRPYEPGDAADIVAGGNDLLTQRWMSAMPSPYTDAEAEWWIGRGSVEGRASGDGVNFAIAENTSGRFVGGIGLHHLDRARRQAEIGYWLAPWGRGKGYAAEATRVLARWGLATLGVHRVNLYAAVGNAPSQRVAEQAGFTREAVVAAAAATRDGTPVDMVLFGLVHPHQNAAATST